MNATATIVSKIWNSCTTLRADDPAAALLARIKAESMRADKSKKCISRSKRNE